MTAFTCICGNPMSLPQNQGDFECPKCHRVYNHQGRFLWREDENDNKIAGGLDRRAEDQDTAIEQAFAEGKLPEEPRRAGDEELLSAETELAGAATGNGVGGGAEATEAPISVPASSPARGEQTHKHEKGAGHKPFKRGKK